MTSEYVTTLGAPLLTIAVFTERELETVRRCCRDADATQPLHALVAALLRGERFTPLPTIPPIPDTDPAPPPSDPAPRPPLPPHPKGKP